jgi:hypothetical protein
MVFKRGISASLGATLPRSRFLAGYASHPIVISVVATRKPISGTLNEQSTKARKNRPPEVRAQRNTLTCPRSTKSIEIRSAR